MIVAVDGKQVNGASDLADDRSALKSPGETVTVDAGPRRRSAARSTVELGRAPGATSARRRVRELVRDLALALRETRAAAARLARRPGARGRLRRAAT